MLKPLRIAVALIACLLAVIALSVTVSAEDIQAIHAYSGDNVKFTGHAAPNTNVTIGVSTMITLPVSNGRFSDSINGIYVPKGSVMSLKAWPVTTLKANGIIHDTTFSSIKEGVVTGDVGTLSFMDIPDGDYDITVYGTSSSDIVSLTVMASQVVTTDASGNYTANASSKGLPAGTYNVTANGIHIADVYLEQKGMPMTASGGLTGQGFEWSRSLFMLDSATGVLLIIAVAIFSLVVFDVYRKRKKK